jgi:hypothetical protein
MVAVQGPVLWPTLAYLSSTDMKAAKDFPQHLAETVKKEDCCSQQVFSVEKTGLNWKKISSSMYVVKEENSLLGFKTAKELLLGSNAADECKFCLCAENQGAFKLQNPKTGVKASLFLKIDSPVIWF